MKYIAIFGYDETTDVAQACVLSDKPSMEPLAYWKKPVQEIIALTISNQFKPLNFGIDRKKHLQQDNGAFSRFVKEGSLVIIAEFVNEKKETIGYRTLTTTNGMLYNMTLADIKQLYLKRKSLTPIDDSVIFIQNAIVRQYDDDITIACYPLHAFEQIEIKQTIKEGKALNLNKITPVQVNTIASKPVVSNKPKTFSKQQKKELELCKEAGVDVDLISNPDLSQDQMRVIWMSKAKKGALAEYYNKPEFSVDAMKFYADILYSKKQAKAYKPLLDHPELTPAQLQELVGCIESGIEFEDLIGLNPDDIYDKRVERDESFWSMADFDAKAPSETWKRGELFDLMMKKAACIHANTIIRDHRG